MPIVNVVFFILWFWILWFNNFQSLNGLPESVTCESMLVTKHDKKFVKIYTLFIARVVSILETQLEVLELYVYMYVCMHIYIYIYIYIYLLSLNKQAYIHAPPWHQFEPVLVTVTCDQTNKSLKHPNFNFQIMKTP